MNVAVIMTGHLRTWNYCKKYIIKALNVLLPAPKDWYVGYWDSRTSTESLITDFLYQENQNVRIVKKFNYNEHKELIKESLDIESTHIGVSLQSLTLFYLRQLMNFQKKVYEFQNNIKYDLVFNIRPDVIYAIDKNTKFFIYKLTGDNFGKFQLEVTGDYNIAMSLGSPTTHDLIQISGTLSSDILNFLYLTCNTNKGIYRRSYLRGGNSQHSLIPQYLLSHLISDRKIILGNSLHNQFISPKIIRPTHPFKDISDQLCTLDKEKISYYLYGDENQWHGLSIEDRDMWCMKKNIDPLDYK